ncbi:MAG: hypothetical protein RI531_08550 [Haloferacaceae archaeon]|nr:hypothetical protein [Haloferacaceae archaeon]
MILQTDKLLEGDVFGYLLDVFTATIPVEILALVLFGSIGVGYYMVQRTVILPLLAFILIGGVTILEGPLSFVQGLVGAFILVVTGIAYLFINRFNTR